MDKFENAAKFGAIMGTLAVKKAGIGDYAGTLVGAGLGGGGTALYDYLMGNEDNRLIRALGGAGAGALGGAAYDYASAAPEDAKVPELAGPPKSLMNNYDKYNMAIGQAGTTAGGIGGGVGGYMVGKALTGPRGVQVAPTPKAKGKAGLIRALAAVLGAGAGSTAGNYGAEAVNQSNAASNPE